MNDLIYTSVSYRSARTLDYSSYYDTSAGECVVYMYDIRGSSKVLTWHPKNVTPEKSSLHQLIAISLMCCCVASFKLRFQVELFFS